MKRFKTAGFGAGTGVRSIGPGGEGRSGAAENRGSGRALAISAFILVTMLLIVAPSRFAAAVTVDEFNLTIPIDTLVLAPEGSTTILATAPVGDQFLGLVCTVAAMAENQESVHPDNDLIVESGSSLVTLEDVEGTAGGVVIADGELELGSEIVVSLIMGPDGVFSAGFVVHVECVAAVTTTTIEATTTTTIEATTTTNGQVASTSVTAPPEETTSTTVDDSVLGTVITSTTVADEVEDIESLPFTGSQDGALLLLAGGLLALGGVLVVGSRREEG
ncbi:MAG: LPXTG cell wall anchor domain-containing protein [Acidimicrobiia bacterium]